jgi:pyruvate,water dikinase
MLAFFPLAAGLIVEVGGMLSHGSIIAREYGLPAVSNITDARKRLKSGDRVLLDGTTGVVQILEPAEARQPAQEASLSKSIKR